MTDLNQLLKNKSEVKLEKEISDFILGIREHKFFKAIQDFEVKTSEGSEKMNIFFWDTAGTAGTLIKEKFMQEYVYAESKQFMDDVQDFKRKLDDLTTDKDYND